MRQHLRASYDRITTYLLFLFAAYGNLDRQDQAWFYLSQATSLALTLGLHREATYSTFGEEEAEERRRVFWLLFVTER